MNKPNNLIPYLAFCSLAIATLSLIPLGSYLSQKEISTDTRTKAAGNTLTVCAEGCQYNGATGIQQAVDAAQDGDTIFIKAGKYFGEQNISKCFLNLGSKSLTLKGEGNAFGEWSGSVLFGEGHNGGRANVEPYATRAGICSSGGEVRIENLHVKEFQGGCLKFSGGRLILKNNLLDGCDSAGAFMTNTEVLAVNNYFVANFGLQPLGRGKAAVKAYNNTFYRSKAIDVSCNQTVPPIDFINNIAVDPEKTIGAGWIYGNCPDTIAQYKTKNIAYNLFWKDNNPCYPEGEYCDDFPHKILADPMYIEPVVEQRGVAGWANFGFREGSPAVGAGDPSIPGPRNLGANGGPCADPNASTCESFISQQLAQLGQLAEPTAIIPTEILYQPPQGDNPPLQPTSPTNNNPPITYYLPPTMSFTSPNQPSTNQPTTSRETSPQNSPTPTITPTLKPLIDVAKTVENARSTWNKLVTSFIQFTKTILP